MGGCGQPSVGSNGENRNELPSQASDNRNLAARVGDIPITLDQVRDLMEVVDGGLDVNQALDVLIRNELLAAEAARRGFSKAEDVASAKRTELARVLLKEKIGNGITVKTLVQTKSMKSFVVVVLKT